MCMDPAPRSSRTHGFGFRVLGSGVEGVGFRA